MAELSEGVGRVFQVHERSRLVDAIRDAAGSGGIIEVDWRLGVKPKKVIHYEMRAGLYHPGAGRVGPHVEVDVSGGVVRGISYANPHH